MITLISAGWLPTFHLSVAGLPALYYRGSTDAHITISRAPLIGSRASRCSSACTGCRDLCCVCSLFVDNSLCCLLCLRRLRALVASLSQSRSAEQGPVREGRASIGRARKRATMARLRAAGMTRRTVFPFAYRYRRCRTYRYRHARSKPLPLHRQTLFLSPEAERRVNALAGEVGSEERFKAHKAQLTHDSTARLLRALAYLSRDIPDKAGQLASNGDADLVHLQLPRAQSPEALRQAQLRFPGNIPHGLG